METGMTDTKQRQGRDEELEEVADMLRNNEFVRGAWMYHGPTGESHILLRTPDEDLTSDVRELMEENGLEVGRTQRVSGGYDHILVDVFQNREERELENELLRRVKSEWGIEKIGIGRFSELYDELGIDPDGTPRVLESDPGRKYVVGFESGDKYVIQYTENPQERGDIGAVFVSQDEMDNYGSLTETYQRIRKTELSGTKTCFECGDEFTLKEVEASSINEQLDYWERGYCGCEG